MGLFDFLNKNKVVGEDFSNVNKDNVKEYIDSGVLVPMYLISPDFGGSENIDNQVVVTPAAAMEKEKIDRELESYLMAEKSVQKFHGNLEYKNHSMIPSKIIFTAIIDGEPYKREINIW